MKEGRNMLQICGIIMVVCGIITLLLPKDKLVNSKKLITDEKKDKIVKKLRLSALIFIILGLLFIFIYW